MAPIKTKEKNINHSFHNIDIGRDMKLIAIFIAVLILFLIPARAAENEVVTETVTMPRNTALSSVGYKILRVLGTISMFLNLIPIIGIILSLVFFILFSPFYIIGFAMVFIDLLLFKLPRLILMIIHFILKIPHYTVRSFHRILNLPGMLTKDVKIFFEGLGDLPGIFLQL